ncbi:MAG: sensor histidine kinase [Pseudomonadota bacterium]
MPLFASTFARRTVGYLAAGLVALLAIVGTSLWLSARTSHYAEAAVRERELRVLTTGIMLAALNAETSQRGYIITQDPGYLVPFRQAIPQLSRDLAALTVLVGDDPTMSKSVAELTTILQKKLAELNQTLHLAEAGRHDDAVAVVRSNVGRSLMDQVRAQLGALMAETDARIGAHLQDVDRGSTLLVWVTAAGALLIMAFAGGAAFTVVQYTRQLVAARSQVQALNAGLEERVAERTAALTRANDEIQRFAYIVSHDLRSPLVNIMGFTSELEAGMASVRPFVDGDAALAEKARRAVDEEIPEALGFIRASTTRMDGLINAILKLSREGRRELRPEPVDLAALFASAAASVRHQTEEAGATIEVPETAPAIVTDRLALEQIVGNLLDNAVKYLSPERPGRIVLAAREGARRVVIEVSDNGRGIAAQDHERIFELFRRAGRQDRPGEGIGLAHVRALTRRLGGDITVQSELGQGATFRMDLPRRLRIEEGAAAK